MLRYLLVIDWSCAVLASCWLPTAESPLAVPVDGADAFEAPWSRRGAVESFAFEPATSSTRSARRDLAWWGAFVEPVAGLQLMLADGGTDRGRTRAMIDAEQVRGRSRSLGHVRAAAGARGRNHLAAAGRSRHARRLDRADGSSPPGRQIELLLENGDELTGSRH